MLLVMNKKNMKMIGVIHTPTTPMKVMKKPELQDTQPLHILTNGKPPTMKCTMMMDLCHPTPTMMMKDGLNSTP
jgi:hypothetical protein